MDNSFEILSYPVQCGWEITHSTGANYLGDVISYTSYDWFCRSDPENCPGDVIDDANVNNSDGLSHDQKKTKSVLLSEVHCECEAHAND